MTIIRHTASIIFFLFCVSAFGQNPSDTVEVRKDSSVLLNGGLAGIALPEAPEDSLQAPDSSVTDASAKLRQKYGGYAPEFLDTVQVKKRFEINDYSLVGVEYGASISRMSFNPSKQQTNLFVPNTFAVFYTRYGKMFNYLPYFGFKIGARYSHEGYKFKENKETGVTPDIEGATQAIMEVAEVPFMAHFHLDVLHFKVMADFGIYGGYRLSIERSGDYVPQAIKHDFLETDRRFDYGLCGGAGFGLVFDPIEFHVNANVRYSWGTIYDPDYYHKDYYRFAYPFDIMVTAGLYFQLTRRTGNSKGHLRREAYNQVYNPVIEKPSDNGQSGSQSR